MSRPTRLHRTLERLPLVAWWLPLLLSGCPTVPAPTQQQAEQEQPAPEELARYAGVQVCRNCHPSAWRAWSSSRHARSTVTLHTGMAMMVAQRMGVSSDCLQEERACLQCHGTFARAAGLVHPAAAGFHPDEGVSCEACHGPAAEHVAAARRQETWPALFAGLRPRARPCPDCHRDKPSHRHELRVCFDEKAFREKIEHGREPVQPPASARKTTGARPAAAQPAAAASSSGGVR